MEATVTPVIKDKQTAPGHKSLVYILALGIFGIITTEFGVIGILPQLAKHFGVTIATAGWLLSAFALVIAVFGPFVTLAASGINRKMALSFVLGIFIVSNLASVMAPSFTVLMVARILPAFFHPIYFSVAMATAAQSVQPSEAPKAVSIVFSGVSIGTVLGVPVAAFFTDLFDWQAAFVVCAIINALALLAFLKLLPSMPVTQRHSFGSQLSVLQQGRTWWAMGVTVLFISGMAAGYGYMAEYFKTVVHMDGKAQSVALLLFGTAGVAGNIIIGRLLSRSVSTAVWSFLLGLIAVQVLLYLNGANFYSAMVLTAIWGFIHTGGFLLGQTLITQSAPDAPEFASALFVSTGNLGFTLGPIAGGLAIDHFGADKLPLIAIGVLLAAALTYLFKAKSNA